MGIIAKSIQPKMSHNYIGRESFATSNPYTTLFDCYTADEYASQYPNIRAIANEYMTIRPHAIDGNGKQVPHPALDALYHPNKKDSSVLFAEKIAVSTLSLPITYILVWRNEGGEAKPGGNFGIKGRNISGYTFLENPAIDVRDGRKYYKMGAQEFTELEVMELPGGAKPKNLYAGYSPSMAASRWSTLDSYIADFQKGFFENGAIPAGQFVVTSVSKQDYEDTVKKLQEAHRGAGKNNNVTYTPRPVDPNTNKPADAKIEWIPYQQSNKDIDFEPLLKHVDNRLSEAYGVSSIIKGVDSAAKYSNAEVSEASFAKRAVSPLALRNYTQITHELNRITGGIGVAITYKYEIPAVSDAEKVKAETKQIEGDIIIKYTSDPYNWSLDSVIDAFGLSNSYKLLKQGTGGAVIDNDKPDVDEGDEVDNAPDPTKIDGVTPLNKKPKAKKKDKKPKLELTDEEKMEQATRSYMQSTIDRVVQEYKDEPDNAVQPEPQDDEIDAYVLAMFAIILPILLVNGEEEYAAGVALAGLNISDLQGFALTETAEDSYRAYLRRVATTYGEDTSASIRKVLLDSKELGWSRAETEKALKGIMDTDDWRVRRLARTELNNSQNMGKLEGMKSLSSETNTDWEKTIDHSGVEPCPLCQSQEGIWTPIEQPLWDLGASINTTNEKGEEVIYINDWQSNEANDYHPNGRGSLVFRRTSGIFSQDSASDVYTGVDNSVDAGQYIEENWGNINYTENQAKRISSYASDDFRGVNKYLRVGESELDGVEKYISALDNAANKAQLKTDTVLMRGMQLSDNLVVGGTFTDKGYVSTTISKSIRDTFVGASESSKKIGSKVYSVEIYAKKGTNIILPDVATKRYIFSEGEMILPRGSQFRVDSIGPSTDGVIKLGLTLL